MPYFEDHYSDVRLPIKQGEEAAGLRRAQLGAIHAFASHFTLRSDPALVAMPTGSGKTAVLMIAPFMLRSNRILVVTPSRLVRNQIAELFSDLALLRRAGVIPAAMPSPRVHELTGKISSMEEWEALAAYDVVVATPQSASPALEGIPLPPENLFDLILVDEAHHSAAKTWNELFASLPAAQRLLVTATPFRRDRREIKGRFVYVYPLKEAYRDNVFGKIEYLPVDPGQDSHDVAIAKAAEQVFDADRAAGLEHYLMVRTDSRKRAIELEKTYADNTGLRLLTIHSGQSYGYIKKTIKKLKDGELDGIICVNMLGEGFDFPNLKIAAIHSPHRSLAVTLQFIGRFSRTAQGVDTAKFLAVPADIEIEKAKLYDDSAVWQNMVIELSGARIDEEVFLREAFDNFQAREDDSNPLSEDVSLSAFNPYCHVKVYTMTGTADLLGDPVLPDGFEIAHRWDNPEMPATVLVAQEVKRPKWTKSDQFSSTTYHLFVIYYDAASKLLFINSTLKQNEVYEELARSLTSGSPKILPLNQINKVLLGMNDPSFYMVGMANRLQSTNTESYRTIMGSGAHKAISESDGQLYHRGHIFGGDADTTVGFSSSSKVWSNGYVLIPSLIEWCKKVATHLTSNREVVTNSPLDYLHTGTTIDQLPADAGVIGALWDIDVFKHPPRVRYRANGQTHEINMLDIELTVERSACTQQSIRLVLSTSAFRIDLDYHLNADKWFTAIDEAQLADVWVERAYSTVNILDYLNANITEFFLSDFSRLLGREIFPGPGGVVPSIPDDQFNRIDWPAKNVDIEREFGPCDDGRISIHTCLEVDLPPTADVIFYDHGSGEVADFIAFTQTAEGMQVSLFHCKGSSGSQPRERVKDFYEVCMQVIKSLQWIENDTRLIKHIEHRLRFSQHFIKGDLNGLKELVSQSRHATVTYRLVVVQPGISHSALAELGRLLAATSDYVAKSRGQRFEVWCSN